MDRRYTRSAKDRRRLGRIITDRVRNLSEEDLEASLAQKPVTEKMGDFLVRTKRLDPEDLARSLADQTGFPYLALAAKDVDRNTLDLVPKVYQTEKQIMVLGRDERSISLAMADPRDTDIALDVETRTGLSPRIWVVSVNRLDAVQLQLFAGDTRARYRLILSDVKASSRVHPPHHPIEEFHTEIRDFSLSGIQLAVPEPPENYLPWLQYYDKDLVLHLTIGARTQEFYCMLAWSREEDVLILGLEFFDRSKEEVRDLYRRLLMKGSHQVSRPPRPKHS